VQSDEDTNSLRASAAANAPDDQPSAPMPATGNGGHGNHGSNKDSHGGSNGHEPELDSLSMTKLFFSAEVAKLAALPHMSKNIRLEDLFVTQPWHRPYAEALLDSDPINLPALIAQAEDAIRSRYVELSITPSPTDELVDLGHAVNALDQLKKASQVA